MNADFQNESMSNSNEYPHTATISSPTGEIVEYDFRVTGEIGATSTVETHSTDVIDGSTVHGVTGKKATDDFRFSGQLTAFHSRPRGDKANKTMGPAELKINGTVVKPGDLPLPATEGGTDEPDAPDETPIESPDHQGMFEYPVPDLLLDDYPWIGGILKHRPPHQREPYPSGELLEHEDADYTVHTEEQFLAALAKAKSGENIYLPPFESLDAGKFDVGYSEGVNFDTPDVTFYSTRDEDGNVGTIDCPKGAQPLFRISADNVRFSGIRIEGPFPEFLDDRYDDPDDEDYLDSTGIEVNANHFLGDNLIVRGWVHAAIHFGRTQFASTGRVFNSSLVDNNCSRLGYGATIWNGNPLFEDVYVDNNRHGISGDGQENCAFELDGIFSGPRTLLQVLDMHRGDQGAAREGKHAGRAVSIHNCVVMKPTSITDGEDETGIYIRGKPKEGGSFDANLFPGFPTRPKGSGQSQGDGWVVNEVKTLSEANINEENNAFGEGNPMSKIGPSDKSKGGK